MTLYSKPVIFMVVSFIVVGLIYSSTLTFIVFAAPPDPNRPGQGGTCGGITTNPRTGNNSQTCCWTERVPGKLPPSNKATYCQTCEFTTAGSDCKPKQQQLGPSSSGVSPLEEGVLEQPPTQGVAPPLTRGQSVLPQDGVLQQQEPADQGEAELQAPEETEPANAEEVPELVCPEGQVIDEETGLCVL